MTCASCGVAMEAGAHFCPSCGAAVVESGARPIAGESDLGGTTAATGQGAYRGSPSAPWSYPATAPVMAGRVGRNLRPLSTVWLVYAGLRAVGGVLGLVVITAISAGHYGPLVWMVGSPVPRYLHSEMWMGFAVPAIIVSTLLACGLALAAGLGLLQRWRSARIVALIAGVLALFRFPLGTALGVYTLWVLLSSGAAAEYESLAARPTL